MYRILFALAASLTLSLTPAFALDQNFVGLWVSEIRKPEGVWTIKWEVARDGTYHSTVSGPGNLPDEYGRLDTEKGAWAVVAVSGREDRGGYEFNDDGSLDLMSAERTHWRHHEAVLRDSFVNESPQLASIRPEMYRGKQPWANGVCAVDPSSGRQPWSSGGAVPGRTSMGGGRNALSGLASGALSQMLTGGAGGGGVSGVASGTLGTMAQTVISKISNKIPGASALTQPGLDRNGATTGGAGIGAFKAPGMVSTPLPLGGSVSDMLTSNFPLSAGADEAAQFCVPELAKLAGGGMVKRRFRSKK